MKVMRKIIEIDEELCDGCGQCVPACAEGAIQVIDGKARIVSEKYCDGLGACLGECPQGALRITEREAEEFDAEAVEEYLESKHEASAPLETVLPCGCPSTQIQRFSSSGQSHDRHEGAADVDAESALSHWPVQIRLVPATAPFLQGAHLLVVADCTPVAYRNFHRDFVSGKTVMVGCPKFDDVQAYVEKFADIFRAADIKKITVVVMEVPCCQGLPVIVKRAMEAAGKTIPMDQVVLSVRGEVLERKRLAA